MPEISPFRGIRYNPCRISDLNSVLAPPYDVISPQARQRLESASPFNIVHILLGKSSETRGTPEYHHSGTLWKQWLEDQVLIKDPEPAFYIYHQEFRYEGFWRRRRGLITLVRLSDYSEGIILPHEQTFPAPKEDRLRLMQACRANLDSVLGLYDDSYGDIADLLADRTLGDPLLKVATYGEEHTLWKITDLGFLREIQSALKYEVVVIADGHHRYETALLLRELHLQEKETPDPNYDYVLMTLVALQDPGLLTLPTHRVLMASQKTNDTSWELFSLLEEIKPTGWTLEESGSLREVEALLRSASEEGYIAFGVLAKHHQFAVLIYSSSPTRFLAEEPLLLHKDILPPLLDWFHRENCWIQYTHSVKEAQHLLEEDQQGLIAFLLRPISPEEVFRTAQRGQRLPEKSTYFFPKLPTGLIMRSLED